MNGERTALVVGAVGLVGAIVGLVLDARIALSAWAAAAIGWSEVAIGALAMLMMVQLVGGSWRPLLRGPLAAGAATLPVIALAFVPVLIGLGFIYPWADPHVVADLPAFKAVWLSPAFFIVRTILYFAVFIGLQQALLRSPEENRDAIAAPGLILYALLASLAGVDWLESVEPSFHSSEFGLIFLSGQWLGGLGLAILIALSRIRDGAPPAAAGVFITALLFWAYLHAMQYIVIWSGNIPIEVRWYIERTETGWVFVSWSIVALQFVLPFLALLNPAVRASRHAMTVIAAVTIALRLVEAAWELLPATGLPTIPTVLLVFSGWAAIGGFGAFWLLRRLPQVEPAFRKEVRND